MEASFAPEIDESEPKIKNVSVPDETPPDRTFTVKATIRNDSEITVPQDGSCQSGIVGTNVAWRNPVTIRVDGQTVHEETVCADASSKDKTVTTRVSISEIGNHRVDVLVDKVPDDVVAEEQSRQINVEPSADDPATPDAGDKIEALLKKLSDSLGATTTQVGAGIAIAVIIFLVI